MTSFWAFPRATVLNVVDGDNVKLSVDQGFGNRKEASFRLFGINAREKSEPGGLEAKANLTGILPAGTLVSITSVRPDKYADRFDAIIWVGSMDVASHLVETYWAALWDGNGPKPLPPWPRPEVAS